jgi:MoxR-like ATPase
MLHETRRRLDVEPLRPSDVTHIRRLIVDGVHVDDKIREYIVRIGRATRAPQEVGLPELGELILLGISPRSYQHVLALARVTAFLEGRDFVLPEDVRTIVPDAVRHRIGRSIRAEAEEVTTDMLVARIIDAVPIP